ncbi:hypothetical protein PCANC_28479 [Puccinia coronata f. sp. avenae]|uniref:DDE Tnp4 domain-containing protein n=1 Tax=Puccinia coronata f. sp. avenae TaxID=200324 RepID=A0A2N5RWS0_9BASI|nr:hypothetical protein PCANC_28479 [Puccinia coronata f. sp. avenae]
MLKRTGKTQLTKRRRLMEELFGDEDIEEEEEDSSSEEYESDSEEEEISQPQRQPNKERNHVEGHQNLMKDYFDEDSTYNDRDFERRFWLRKQLVLKIIANVKSSFPYFVQKPDCTGKIGLSSTQKIISALRQLAYGCAMDATDKYCRTSEATARKCLKSFCNAIIYLYGKTFLQKPDSNDLIRILDTNNRRGFPGCIGSLDCMHWAWKNCPTALAGQYKGKEKKPTVVLEAVADQRMWIWHCYFGTAGALNDINVLEKSLLFKPMLDAKGVNQDPPSQHFQKLQEAARKDIERAFGVLQGKCQPYSSQQKQIRNIEMKSGLQHQRLLNNLIDMNWARYGAKNSSTSAK